MSVFKPIDFNDLETQKRLTELVQQATLIVVGEANDGENMNDTFLNLDMQMFLTKEQDSLTLSEIYTELENED